MLAAKLVVLALAFVLGLLWWLYNHTINPDDFEFCEVCATPKRPVQVCPTCQHYKTPKNDGDEKIDEIF